MGSTYSIGEIARRIGLTPSALRYYETIGLLPAPEREGGRRRYDQDTLDRLAMISVAQRAGFSLREARTLMAGLEAEVPPSAEWRDLARTKLEEIETIMARAQGMRELLRSGLDCDCLALEDIESFRRACVEWAHAAAEQPLAGS